MKRVYLHSFLFVLAFLFTANLNAQIASTKQVAGQRNGYHTHYFQDGSRFEGHFNNDVIEGSGIYYWDNSHYYVGHWRNGKRDGYGVEVFDDGKRFKLEYFENEVMMDRTLSNIKSKETSQGIYQGGMLNGEAFGKGTFRWKNGQWFEGTWTSGRQIRYGVLYHANSLKPWVIGTWENEKREGYGCEISESGEIKTGFWKNGVYQYKTRF